MNGLQGRLGRVALGWSVLELADAASVSTQTIVRLERGEELRPATLQRIRNVLENAGIVFISEDNDGSFGILIRRSSLT
ncbi:helix-turn-helix domain-containing protein [Brucella pseudogrignonensis]|uniref:XRE family transcriptional regulator n=1 Tax=Brucella pseudogrignonensis TaxID=419475 RepID=A0A7Y3T8U7_9HYPH|nr:MULTISPECIES: helix-turn-helix transcriptional regulator [Brucella]ANG99515.1 transcriptional regulator [Brucella pseudogrignonensis]MCD4512004.1 helix-turn-helix domain-containing protein [Brucella pseudogrignonensis]MCM0753310.1 XRE family transcriptional regulator [Brucella pseudogrignonensis]NNV23226.1 XRE family transcriptional regulator [Brucella pseudogrignonensis]